MANGLQRWMDDGTVLAIGGAAALAAAGAVRAGWSGYAGGGGWFQLGRGGAGNEEVAAYDAYGDNWSDFGAQHQGGGSAAHGRTAYQQFVSDNLGRLMQQGMNSKAAMKQVAKLWRAQS